ncbi:class I SAM-dependent methyltransferase [Halomonas halocynthiae]|uniref:class I SAM-dependent methyltransferase n=1 Tax=Halomonas halocynthiae TaxID=176290 RepID=UPI0004011B4C|nr:class I SAM-dependent methyltransferase [Halomonas halocynthiae]
MTRERKRKPQRRSGSKRHPSDSQRRHQGGTLGLKSSSAAAASTDTLLSRARTHWLFGEWQRLCELDAEHIAQQRERAAIALLVSSAQQQQGDHQATRHWARQSIRWGMAPNAVARLLAAGVHNTLGRMALLREDDAGIGRHFAASMELAALNDTDTGTLVRARASQEAKALNQRLPSLSLPEPMVPETLHSAADGFYRAFEDRFRGSREEIKRRVEVYLPFVVGVAERHPGVSALDLGCGRGEWLEVLGAAGLKAEGIDQDADMLGGCRELGLKVSQGDALAFLKQQPDASRISISLMHVVEHIPFEMLRSIVAQARRVLVPDGVLIMETPNPENIMVGSCSFYMDPTHRNPLPSPLLAFVPEYYGFERVKVLRLQEEPALHDKTHYVINDFLRGVSPDYAVLAQGKQATITETPAGQQEQAAWEHNFGISLDQMMQRNNQGNDE